MKPSTSHPTEGGASMEKDDLESCPCDPVLHTPRYLGPTSHVQDDQAIANDDDDDLLDVLTEKILSRKAKYALQQDTDANIIPAAHQAQHFMTGRTGTVRVPPAISRPGAYALRPSVDSFDMSHDTDDCIVDEVTRETEATENSQEGLPVANLVEQHDLKIAFPDTEAPKQQRKNKTKPYKTSIFRSVIFLLATGAVLLAIHYCSPTKNVSRVSQAWTITPLPPSQAPSSLGVYVLSLLPEETANVILGDSNSPQSRAFLWLLHDDLLYHMPEEQIKQRFALATLYFATNGDHWTDNTNWLNYSLNECDWYTKGEFLKQTQIAAMFLGFLSGFFTSEEGPTTICDQHGLYQHLWLDENNLVGSLPDELYMLTHLKTISMSFNGLQGAISSRIGLLTELEAWALSYLMPIGGTIPTQIGLLTNLRFISSEANGHQGTIPTEIWHLSKLEYCFFGRNHEVKGTIPTEIGHLLNLKWFANDETALSGTIPTEIGLLQSIKMFSLNRNSFSGTMPSELGLLSDIFFLGLVYNDLTGTMPIELGLLTSLSQLSLKGNHLKGPIPSQLGLLTNLSWALNLKSNQLTGTIPSELGLLTVLPELELRDNRLTGQIPSELGQATSMGIFSFANNFLSGSVPQELYSLHALLHTLSLEGNPQLSGMIPNEICEINATCIGNGFNPCEAPYGFSFNCSSLLCGCGCNLCIP